MRPRPVDRERTFRDDEIIVSKTDLNGRITYANDVFLKVAGYTEREVLGKAHSWIRHPDMPRGVFKVLWDTIQGGDEIFAYVKNLAKDGHYYWVFAHVTPTFDDQGRIIGYHSNRRTPRRAALPVIESLYRQMLEVENGITDVRDKCAGSIALLQRVLADKKVTYAELMFALELGEEAA